MTELWWILAPNRPVLLARFNINPNISNYIVYKMWGESTFPFSYFNSARLRMDKSLRPVIYLTCDYTPMLQIHFGNRWSR